MSPPVTFKAPAHPDPAVLLLDPAPAAVRHARDFVQVRSRAAGLDEDTCDSLVLLVSEVVTNAFLHGRSQTRLTVTIAPTAVRVEVSDDNSRHPTLVPPDDGALDGRGMALVDMVATVWGVRDDPIGKTVWFELATP